MEFSQDKTDGYFVESYQPGSVIINGQTYQNNLIITAKQIIEPWELNHISELSSQHFDIILTLDISLFILGTGHTQKFPETKHFSTLIEKKIGFEIMNTVSACQTYNILMSENRKVAAGLIL